MTNASMTQRPHVLVISETEDGERQYAVECPEVTNQCRAWLECRQPGCDKDELDENDGLGHGVQHQEVAGSWSLPED